MLWKGFRISDPWFALFTTIFFPSLPKVIWGIKAVQADKKEIVNQLLMSIWIIDFQVAQRDRANYFNPPD